MKAPEDIRTQFQKGMYRIGRHCHDKMSERGIREDDIVKACLEGTVIDRQSHGRDEKLLFQSTDVNGELFYCVVAVSNPQAYVITACRFSQDVWVEADGVMKRRRK